MIKKLIIEINKKKIELSLDEAKKLYEDLNVLFDGETETVRYIPYYPYYPNYETPPIVTWTYYDNTLSDNYLGNA